MIFCVLLVMYKLHFDIRVKTTIIIVYLEVDVVVNMCAARVEFLTLGYMHNEHSKINAT